VKLPLLPPKAPRSPEEIGALVDKLARAIVGRRLEVPVTIFLESHRPLTFFASQGLLLAVPVLGAFIPPSELAGYAEVLDSEANLDQLLDRIEELVRARNKSAANGKVDAPGGPDAT